MRFLNAAGKLSTPSPTNPVPVTAAPNPTAWSYSAPGSGLANSAVAVTIKAAAGAGLRNFLKSAQINSEALTTATELVIRDGASGTVLWRGKIPTTGWTGARDIVFDPPLRGTPNTLMEICTLTASGAGAVYFNAQGFTGA